ncbi:MAG: aminotransferase class V-fold PLP-dependent enzyme, partial [Nitrospinae bacterium]|nr:aminotransferase class V-fold PLP-dependent enzyme [Nitrospinota bacterium]
MPESDTLTTAKPPFDVDKIRADFPVLSQKVHGKPLVYLDNAATTQKPRRVIDKVQQFDAEEYGTVRRGSYKLSEQATRMFEDVRQKVADLFGAAD